MRNLLPVLVGVGLVAPLPLGCQPEADPDSPTTLLPAAQVTAPTDGNWRTRLPAATRFDNNDVVERWATADGRFALHFTRAGRHAVPATDGDGNQIPDLLQAVGAALSGAQAVYTEQLGFRLPIGSMTSAGAPLDVFLVDFGGRGDGSYIEENCRPSPPRTCAGLLLLENDFAGYPYGSPQTGASIVASHELFHAVQSAYDKDDSQILSEGTATLATEQYDPRLNDFERAIPAFFMNPDQALGLAPIAPASPFSYGSAMFFHYLTARHGMTLVRELYTAVESQPPAMVAGMPRWLAALGPLLQARGTTFAAAFTEFARWNMLTGPRASPDPQRDGGHADGRSYPPVAALQATLPINEIALRIFPAAARYFTFRAVPGPIIAQVVGGGDAPLELTVVYEDPEGGHLLARGPRGATFTAPASATRVLVGVSNGALGGNSTRIGLCIGDDPQVKACAASVSPTIAGAGPSAADGGSDAARAPGGGDGGCSLHPGAAAQPARPVTLLMLLGLLVAGRRWRANGRTLTCGDRCQK